MKTDEKTAMVTAFVGAIDREEVAEAAANAKAICQIYRCVIRDEVMREIVVGHAVVIVAYGSEVSTTAIKEAVEAMAI
jgi:hypothetical protein